MTSPKSQFLRRFALLLSGALFLTVHSASALYGQDPALPESWAESLQFRSIGPANMGGRITALAVYEKSPSTWWAASASGGLLKTTNNGITFEHQFDSEATVSIGDVQVFQGESEQPIVWVGTGEANPRNSSSWGNGVYRSTDGGESWEHLGLDKTFQTGRIALHPSDPNIAYVGALGRLWGESEERGLYKTTDGGKTWNKVLHIDNATGIIDVKLHPTNPETLIAATYERQRDGFDGNDPVKKYGEGSGIYKSTDGGETFKKLTEGLPTVKLGRIGLCWYRSDPNFVYAIVESELIGKEPENAPYMGITGEDADVGARLTQVTDDGPSSKAGLKTGDIVVAVDGESIFSYDQFIQAINARSAGDEMKVGVVRDRESQEFTVTIGKRPESNNRRSRFTGTLGGQAANLQDVQGKDGFQHGGIYRSDDVGETWTRINTLNPRPMYYSHLQVDPSDNQKIYVCGTSLYRSSDGGKTFTGDGGSDGIHVDHHALWIDARDGDHMILGNDGGIHVTYDRMTHWDHLAHVAIAQFYHVGVDATRDYHVYGGLQDNGSWGGPSIVRDGSGPVNEDWFRVGGGDGFLVLVDPEDENQLYYESQNGAMGTINLETGQQGSVRPRAPRGTRYRFNWKTPFILSPHNSRVHYSAGNHVFRSLYKGSDAQAISPDITNTDRGAGSAISESATQEGVIYVGTTDGALWATTDGGQTWVNLFENPDAIKAPNDRAYPSQAVTKETAAEPAESKSDAEDDGDSEESVDDPESKPDSANAAASASSESAETKEGSTKEGSDEEAKAEAAAASSSDADDSADDESADDEQVNRRRRFVEMLMQGDENKDGKLTREEAPPQFRRFFDRFDENEDNILDEEELKKIGGGGQASQATALGSTASAANAETQLAIQYVALKRMATQQESAQEEAAASAENALKPLVGMYDGNLISDQLPADRGGFELDIKLDDKGKLTGTYGSAMAEGEITGGSLNTDTGEFTVNVSTGQAELVIQGKLKGNVMNGTFDVNEGSFVIDFEATKTKSETEEEMESSEASEESEASAPTEQQEEQDEEPKAETATEGPLKSLVPGPRWVSSLEASQHSNGRCYMTLDGHRSNDDEPYVFVTENYGKTWKSIRANLPTLAGSTRVIREDIENENLLYLGCEFSAWVSIDRGASWTQINGDLPTVAVHEFAIHPTSGEVVLGTHGRSLWIMDVSALRQISKESIAAAATLYEPQDAVRWRTKPAAAASSTRRFVGENPASGAQIYYSLGKDAESVELVITDLMGETIAELETTTSAGLHLANWNLRRRPQGGRGGRGGRFRGASVSPGVYFVYLTVDGEEFEQVLTVVNDPSNPGSARAEFESELLEAFQSGEEEESESREASESMIR